jgi:hypothetical protein
MKLSKPLSASILIVSALLLNAVRSVNAQGLGPSQSLTQQRNDTPKQTQAQAKQSPSPTRVKQAPPPVNSVNGQSTSDEIRKDGDQYAGLLRKVREWILGISAQGFFNFIIAAATLAMAVFSYLLVCVTRELHKATEGALYVNRPFLMVTKVECTDTKFINGALTHKFAIHLKNFGVGPADIVTYIASADPNDTPIGYVTEIKEPELRYFPENGQRLSDSLVGPGEEVTDRIECRSTLDPSIFALVQDRSKTLGINGIITYRGTAPKSYETRFFWWFFMDADYKPIRFVRAFRPDLNSHT